MSLRLAWLLFCISYFSADVVNYITKATYRRKHLFWLTVPEGHYSEPRNPSSITTVKKRLPASSSRVNQQ